MEKFLVTTAKDTTWPKNNENILFLGEWCKLYSKKKTWENLDYSVLDYHWDNREKFEKDYYYLISFYEEVIETIAIKMNQIHQVNHGVKYWRILLGPWLSLFIQSVFDRWEMIQKAINSSHSLSSITIKELDSHWTPKDFNDFKNLVIQDDGWNNFIYGKIIELHADKININNLRQEDLKSNSNKDLQNSIKVWIFNLYQFFVNIINSNRSSLIISSYLNRIDDLKLSLKLFQLPLFINLKKHTTFSPDIKKREWSLNMNSSSSFEKFILDLIPAQLPTVYLEGYDALVKKVDKINWPKSPKSIFTSNSIYGDELFKHYAGIKNSSRLIVGQHGGGYGISKLSFPEYHELSIADKFVSWGWSNQASNTKIYPLGQFNSRSVKKSSPDKTKFLIVTTSMPRYSYVMQSMCISSQWLSYFADQINLTKQIKPSILSETTIRLYRHDYGWSQLERWKELMPNLTYDSGESKIEKHYCDTKLCLATCNATTYLETFRLNIPTVLFWDPYYWENRESALPIFNELKRVKVFHETPESAANHINEIWDDVRSWWESEDVVGVINKFNKAYNKNNKNSVSGLVRILK